MKTSVMNPNTIERSWYVVDANDVVLGRLSSKVANILMGKGKPAYSPNQDHGDFVVIINADKVVLTGKKEDMKEYFRHSKKPGGEKFRTVREQRALDASVIIKKAVHGMCPKTKLGRAIEKKLFVYSGAEHPHAAQKPEAISL